MSRSNFNIPNEKLEKERVESVVNFMSFIDQILSSPTSKRGQKLQHLIRFFLNFDPTLIEEVNYLIASGRGKPIKSTQNFKPIKRKPIKKIFRKDWKVFHQLSQKKQENMLEDCVVSLFHKICDNGKKTILIQHDTSNSGNSRIFNFCGSDIVETIRYAGFNCWLVDTPVCNELCLSFDKALLERMNFVSLILVGPYGLSFDYNTDTKTFRLPYVASGPPETDRSILLTDYFYVPNHRTTDAVFERYQRSVPLPRDLTRHRRTFTAIPVGNLKNSRIRKARQSIRPEDRNKILFCAEAYDYANSVAKDYGIMLIRKILDRFSNNTIVYRPHPNWVNHPISLNIQEAFVGEPRFIFDTNTSSETIMSYGCALITDGSVSGLTYCLAASRPAIYFNPLQLTRHFNPDVMGFNFENGELFRFTSTIDETLDALEDLVADPAKEFEEITALAEKAYAHPNDGMDYFIASIHAIVENAALSDWKTLKISNDEIGNESATYYSGLIKNDLLFVHQYHCLLEKDLSELDSDHVLTGIIKNFFYDIHRYTHLAIIINNFNALISGIVRYGCSSTAIKIIDPLLAPIIIRGNKDELGNAIKMLQKAYSRILYDAQKSTNAIHLMQLFKSTLAGTIQSKVMGQSHIPEQELYTLRSLAAETLLASNAPNALISSLKTINDDSCQISFSCAYCGVHQTMRDIQIWFSYNATCKACGMMNHVDPFEKALHLPDVFFHQLPHDGEVVMWGAGGFYDKLMRKYKEFFSNRFLLVDAKNTQQGLSICNKKVLSPDIILDKNIKTIIITALKRKDEICATILENYPFVEHIFVPALDITPEGVVPFLKKL